MVKNDVDPNNNSGIQRLYHLDILQKSIVNWYYTFDTYGRFFATVVEVDAFVYVADQHRLLPGFKEMAFSETTSTAASACHAAPMHWIRSLQKFVPAIPHGVFLAPAHGTVGCYLAQWASTWKLCAHASHLADETHWPTLQCSTISNTPASLLLCFLPVSPSLPHPVTSS